MKKQLLFLTFLLPASGLLINAQESTRASLEKGVSFIQTKVYTAEEDSKLLEQYKDLRVSDVSDGLDMAGLPGTGLVDRSIHAAWIDLKDFRHVFRGIAVTVRYVPTQKPDRPRQGEDFSKWEGTFYGSYSSEAFSEVIRPGSAIVIDDVEDKDIGTIGSNNILNWFRLGATGVVTDACARDNDEIGLEGIPLYFRKVGRGIRPGRNELESVNRPVSVGGVLVCPGDVVVADGDGVVVVPRAVAAEVAKYASAVLVGDKEGRRGLYKSLGRPLDKTVK
jgi:4-hydroxy-4-methyl-2-oxoglutarate aldolase